MVSVPRLRLTEMWEAGFSQFVALHTPTPNPLNESNALRTSAKPSLSDRSLADIREDASRYLLVSCDWTSLRPPVRQQPPGVQNLYRNGLRTARDEPKRHLSMSAIFSIVIARSRGARTNDSRRMAGKGSGTSATNRAESTVRIWSRTWRTFS